MSTKTPRTTTVYEEIKARILSLEYSPGTALTEIALSEKLGVSRTPVREALKLLQRDKLVCLIPNKGAVVKGISLNDIKEIFQLREIIETFCAGQAATSMGEENVSFLEARLAESLRLFEAGDYVGSSLAGSDIHKVIVGVVGNSRVIEVLRNVEEDVSRLQHLTATLSEKLRKSNDQHFGIVEAIKLHDAHLAERKMREHIRSVREDALFEYVTKMVDL